MSKTKGLTENLGHFEAGLGNAPVTVFAQDLQMHYIWIYNPLPGLFTAGTIGKTDGSFLPEEEARLITAIKQETLQRGEPRQARIRLILAGESRFYQLFVCPRHDEDGMLAGTLIDLSALPVKQNGGMPL